MTHGFVRHAEAQLHASTVTNTRARVALALVHQLILESAGMRLHLLPERYSPIQTLDALYFYKTVERLFTEWGEEVRAYPEVPVNKQSLLHLSEATALIPTLTTERARVGLTNYLSILRNTPVPEGTFVDALFCCRLLAVLLSRPELLERILSGDESWAAINPWEGILD